MTTQLLYANNAAGTLFAAITNTSTTFTLNGSAASLFPSPSTGQAFYGTFTDAATQTLIEIVLVTSNAAGVLTCTRGQDGTSALSWNANDIFSQRVVRAELQKFEAAADGGVIASVPNGYINGFTLSNDVTLPNTVLDIAAGIAADSTNAVAIAGTAFTKSTAGSWAAGSGNNGMGTGLTIAASTWYHVFAILNAGSYDVYFDTSPVAANKPSGTTAFRYIGSFETNASSQIALFFQFGQRFYWAAGVTDINEVIDVTAALYTLSVPPGFNTYPILQFQASGGMSLWSPFAGATGNHYQINGNDNWQNPAEGLVTNTASQIYARSTNGTSTMLVETYGYVNPHVAPNF